jgi:hypothetical protein
MPVKPTKKNQKCATFPSKEMLSVGTILSLYWFSLSGKGGRVRDTFWERIAKWTEDATEDPREKIVEIEMQLRRLSLKAISGSGEKGW